MSTEPHTMSGCNAIYWANFKHIHTVYGDWRVTPNGLYPINQHVTAHYPIGLVVTLDRVVYLVTEIGLCPITEPVTVIPDSNLTPISYFNKYTIKVGNTIKLGDHYYNVRPCGLVPYDTRYSSNTFGYLRGDIVTHCGIPYLVTELGLLPITSSVLPSPVDQPSTEIVLVGDITEEVITSVYDNVNEPDVLDYEPIPYHMTTRWSDDEDTIYDPYCYCCETSDHDGDVCPVLDYESYLHHTTLVGYCDEEGPDNQHAHVSSVKHKTCAYCRKVGHSKDSCSKLVEKEKRQRALDPIASDYMTVVITKSK